MIRLVSLVLVIIFLFYTVSPAFARPMDDGDQGILVSVAGKFQDKWKKFKKWLASVNAEFTHCCAAQDLFWWLRR